MKFLITIAAVVLMSMAACAQGWEAQDSPTPQNLTSVVFVDTSYGWAVGDSGTILHTANGGSDWILEPSIRSNSLYAVAFVDRDQGWAVGESGLIIHTSDGGTTWIFQSSDDGYTLNDIDFIDASHGWAVGSIDYYQGTILHTSDAGISWIVQSDDTTCALFGVEFTNASEGWASGSAGKILHTTNGGITWALQFDADFDATGGFGRLIDVHFVDDSIGWAAGYCRGELDGVNWKCIFSTSDGGNSWTDLTWTIAECGRLFNVCFADASHGWAVGDPNCGGGGSPDDPVSVLYTSDGGTIWLQQYVTSYLRGVSFTDGNHGWAVGNDGTIFRYNPEPEAADEGDELALSFGLASYPNPFNATATISFDLPNTRPVTLRVFDLLGRDVAVLKDGMMEAGNHRVTFDGSRLASGIYFARLEAGEFVQTKKLMLMK